MRLSLFIVYLSALILGNFGTAHARVTSVRDNTVYNHKPSHNDQARIFFHADFRLSPQTTITGHVTTEVLAEEKEDEDFSNHLHKQVKHTGNISSVFSQIFSPHQFQYRNTFVTPEIFIGTNRYLRICVLRI